MNAEDKAKNPEIEEQEAKSESTEETTAQQEDTLEELTEKEETTEAKQNETQAEKTVEDELQEAKDKYIRLYSDFENFRRRTAKEKMEFLKTANEDLMKALLPVLDDFDRAQKSIGEEVPEEATQVKEALDILQNRLVKVLQGKGLASMGDLKGADFDADFHEAITQIPAPEENLKGKIVDTIEQGYKLEDKVIRFAKVVVGS